MTIRCVTIRCVTIRCVTIRSVTIRCVTIRCVTTHAVRRAGGVPLVRSVRACATAAATAGRWAWMRRFDTDSKPAGLARMSDNSGCATCVFRGGV